jgi:hypothetical protein
MNMETIKRRRLPWATSRVCWAICVASVAVAGESRPLLGERVFSCGATGNFGAEVPGRLSSSGLRLATLPNRSNRRKMDVAVGGGSWQGQWRLEAVHGSPVAVGGSPSKFTFPLFSGLKRQNRGKLTKTLPLTASNCHLDDSVLGVGIGVWGRGGVPSAWGLCRRELLFFPKPHSPTWGCVGAKSRGSQISNFRS